MALKLYNKGSSSVATSFNYDVPTNPRITNESAYSGSTRVFSILYPDDSTSESFNEVTSGSGLLTEYSNLTTTKGFRIRCYDSVSQTGIQLDTITLNTHYYFVLIHSDDENLHHFAKVTQTINEDVDGDAFEFTPSLGKEIPKDTKFMIFKGPVLTSSALAFTAGIKNELQDFLSLSRPIFYFDTSFDKKNELNHNTKYFLRMNGVSSGSSVTVNSLDTTFLTTQDFSNAIIDYSPFSLHVNLTDNLRDLDNPEHYRNFTGDLVSGLNEITLTSIDVSKLKVGSLLTGTGIQNDTVISSISGTQTIYMSKNANATGNGVAIKVSPINELIPLDHRDFTDYEKIFPNARRDSDDNLGTLLFTGSTRYAHYDFSPAICNKLEGVIDTVMKESVGNRAGLAESKLIDNHRILPNKVTEGEPYRIRHDVFRASLNDWVEMDIELSTYSVFGVDSARYNVITSYSDLTDFLNMGDEVLINNRIYIISFIFSNYLVLHPESRTELESTFASHASYTTLTGNKVYRRAYNATDKTLLTGFDIIEGRTYNLYVKLNQDPFSFLYASVTASDKNKKLLTLSFDGDAYSTNLMEYAQGNYIISIERFNGEVENIDSYKESSQTFMEIVGRDTYSKLLSPIVNSNKLFSKDMIYSSDSFYNNLEAISGVTFNADYTDQTIDFSGSHGLSVGDKLFGEFSNGSIGYVGKVASITDTDTVELEEHPRLEAISPTNLNAYKIKEKNYVFNKALSSNYRSIDTVTSLVGTADKGVIFEGGIKLTSTGDDGSVTDKLTGASSNDNADALGYPIFEPSSMKSDKAFQAKLKETTAETFDVVNTLNDFTVLSISEDNDFTLVELAPYVPLSLGRVEYNYQDTQDTTFTTVGTAPTTTNSRSFAPSGIGSADFDYEEPVFVDGVFVGLAIHSTSRTNTGDKVIYLDRKATFSSGNLQKISYKDSSIGERNKFSHSLNLLNGGHLHGGKNIALLGSQTMSSYVSNPLSLYDFPINYTTATSKENAIFKFGLPMYRVYDLEKGQYNTFNSKRTTWSEDYDLQYYYEKLSEVKYYASAYRFGSAYYLDSGTYKDSIVGIGKTGDISQNENTSLVESRGYRPANGSRFFDTKHHESGGSSYVVYKDPDAIGGTSPFRGMDVLQQIDPKVSRMFLFVNSDLLPYSNVRKDSLLNPSRVRDITNYNLMLLKSPTERNDSTTKQSMTKTNVISNVDNDYELCNITSSDRQLNNINSFSVMRLTEVVYDWAFNQIDPENLPKSDRTLPKLEYQFSSISNTGISITSTASSTVVNVGSDPTTAISANDILLTDKGVYIGEVQSTSSTQITFKNDIYHEDGGGTNYSGVLLKRDDIQYSTIQGVGDKTSFTSRDDRIHMTKGAFLHRDEYGGSGTRFTSKFSGDYDTFPSSRVGEPTEILIPVDLGQDLNDYDYPSNHTSRVMKIFATSATENDVNFVDKAMMIINFSNYSIEDGGDINDNDRGLVTEHIEYYNRLLKSSSLHSIIYSPSAEFRKNKDLDLVDNYTGNPSVGSNLGFKFRLKLDTANRTTDKITGNRNVYHYTVTTSRANQNNWLNLINDLTGCYLVSEKGSYYSSTLNGVSTSNTANQDSQISLNNVVPEEIAYVLSHEIDVDATSVKHIITVDNNLTTDYYRIMQPNHTCFHDYTPTRISLNKLSSSYTKKGDSESMYETINSYRVFNQEAGHYYEDGTTENQGGSEAALSMYVLVDTDKRGSSQNRWVVRRGTADADDIVPTTETNVCISDGENVLKSSIKLEETSLGYDMVFGQINKMVGVVSISDILTVKIPNNVDSEYTRAMIGAGVTIANDAEDIINELLEENDITFNLTEADYPQYLAPNFQGVDLFSAINYLLKEKKKSLIKENETFIIKDESSNDFYADVVLSDNGEYQIFNYEKTSTIFDQYNEVIVYGRFHRATRKDLRDINKRGRKTIEVFERELTNQTAVDKRATELLRLYSSDNVKIQIEVGHKGINQLRVGDIVSMELRRENIPLNEYLVLEMEHLLTGNIKLTLGKYSKQLEDRFADLLIEGKKTNTAIRELDFNQNEVNYNFLQDIKVKPLRLLVRKRASTGTFKLGFTQPLGFVLELGFYGAVQITDLLEEEY